MRQYKLTVFEQNGEKILDETIEASDDEQAKKIGLKILTEQNFIHKTHRCVSPEGKLLLFHM